MAGGTTDDGPQADDGVVLAAFGHFRGDEWDLKGAGDPGHMDILLTDIVADQAVHCPAEELGGNELVEPGGHDAHPDAAGDQFSFQCFHVWKSSFLLLNSAGYDPYGPAWS